MSLKRCYVKLRQLTTKSFIRTGLLVNSKILKSKRFLSNLKSIREYFYSETNRRQIELSPEIKKGAKLKIPRSFSYGQENNEDLEIPEIQDTNEIENEIIYDSLIENITNYEKKRVAIMLPFRTKNIFILKL